MDPPPTPEEAAAIAAALEIVLVRDEREEPPRRGPGRWELAGRLGRPLPVGRSFEGSPWSYPRLGVEA